MKINNKNNSKVVAEAYAAYDAKAKDPAKMITESWAPMIERVTGVKDPEKLAWMSLLAHNTAKLNEDAFQLGSNTFAQQGGTYTPYNNLYNTVGVGNPVPAGKPALTGADYADNTTLGSGDKYPALLPLALKVAAKTIGFELVNTTPIQGPTGVLPYMDYVYSGSKQPYGATPAYDSESANPRYFNQKGSKADFAYSHFGLPASFKASIVKDGTKSEIEGHTTEDKSVSEIKAELKDANKKLLLAGTQLTATVSSGAALVVEFVGWSRIDGNPMFKVVSGDRSLGDYFDNVTPAHEQTPMTVAPGVLTLTGNCMDKSISIKIAGPQLISMLEDQIQGFTGAGERDRDAWYGTYQDGTVLYEPMSRGTGEMTMPRQLSLQLFTKHIQVGTIQVGCAVTQEQVTDLQKQWGIDVVKMVENAGINELSSTINRHITSRLFALGWKNHCKLVEVEGNNANLNLSFDPKSGTTTKMTPALAIPQGETDENGTGYTSYTNVALPYKPLYINQNATFENRDTLLKRIATNIMLASNWIQQRGRYGAATFVVTNITVASALQSNAHYTFSPIDNTINQTVGNLYPIGTLAGLTIYVDPLMGGNDTRVLVGRKGGKDEPGVHFCPYVMAESVKIIAEGTAAPKLYIKSRYALVDAGFFPETQYITFCVDMAGI